MNTYRNDVLTVECHIFNIKPSSHCRGIYPKCVPVFRFRWTEMNRKISKALFTLSRYTALIRPGLDTEANRNDNHSDIGTVKTRLTYHAGLLRSYLVVLRRKDGPCRNATAMHQMCMELADVATPEPLSGDRRYNTVCPDSIRTGAVYRDSVN